MPDPEVTEAIGVVIGRRPDTVSAQANLSVCGATPSTSCSCSLVAAGDLTSARPRTTICGWQYPSRL
jgi:hypothetical protein